MQHETITHMSCACPRCDNFILLVIDDYRQKGPPECPECKIFMGETSPRTIEKRSYPFLAKLKSLVKSMAG